MRLLLVPFILAAGGCATDTTEVTTLDDAFDPSGKADGLDRYRPAWPEPRSLAVDGVPLSEQVLRYQPSVRVETETTNSDGSTDVDIELQRPDGAWTEVGRYVIEASESRPIAVSVFGGDVIPLSTAIGVKRWSDGELLVSEQATDIEFTAQAGEEYRLVVVPMSFSAASDTFTYSIRAR